MKLELDETLKVLDEYCYVFKKELTEEMFKADKIATGNLLGSIELKVMFGNTNIRVIISALNYMRWVESGRKPGKFPNVGSIIKWIQDKPITPYKDKNGKIPTEKQLAYLIGRKIKDEGIKPGNFIENTKLSLNERYKIKIKEALEKDLVKTIINKIDFK